MATEPDRTPAARPPSLGRDALFGLLLFLLIVLSLMFSTGEDTSFIYIDF